MLQTLPKHRNFAQESNIPCWHFKGVSKLLVIADRMPARAAVRSSSIFFHLNAETTETFFFKIYSFNALTANKGCFENFLGILSQ